MNWRDRGFHIADYLLGFLLFFLSAAIIIFAFYGFFHFLDRQLERSRGVKEAIRCHSWPHARLTASPRLLPAAGASFPSSRPNGDAKDGMGRGLTFPTTTTKGTA